MASWIMRALLIAAAVGPCGTASAATIHWAGAVSGNWSVATNWSPAQVPAATDDVIIDPNGTYTVTLNGTSVIAPSTLSLIVDGYDLASGVIFRNATRTTVNETFPWHGAHSTATNHCNTATLALAHDLSFTPYTLEIRAFNDGITKLLWPQTRENVIKRTSVYSELALPIGKIRVPAGTPVNLLANIDPRPLGNKLGMLSLGIVNGIGAPIDDPIIATTILKRFNQVPDLLEDEGHLFGANLSDADKLALIEFLKTL